MSGPVPTCGRPVDGEQPCGAAVKVYRQCPIPGCGVEIARCSAHGGDDRAIALIREHMTISHPPVRRP